MLLPQPGEVRAGSLESADQAGPRGLADMPAVVAPELRDQPAQLVVPADVGMAAVGLGEVLPQDVALTRLGADHPGPQRGVRLIPAEQVIPLVQHRGRERHQAVHDALDVRRHLVAGARRAPGRAGGFRNIGQPVQVLPLGLIEPQGLGHRAEHLGAGLDRAALLEPRVPGDAHPGQLGDLLPAQPGGATAQPRGQPHLLRADPFPAAAQERSQLSAARTVPVGRHGGHNLIMPGSGGWCQVLLVPG
jgi:hypothetical protein